MPVTRAVKLPPNVVSVYFSEAHFLTSFKNPSVPYAPNILVNEPLGVSLTSANTFETNVTNTVYPLAFGLIQVPPNWPPSQVSAIHIAISLALRTLFTSRSATPSRLSGGVAAQPRTNTIVVQMAIAVFILMISTLLLLQICYLDGSSRSSSL
jgi:hypothetical protein